MPDLRISELPLADALTGAELVPVVQGGVTSRTTTDDIAGLGGGGGGGGSTVTAMAVINNVGDFITPNHPGVDSVTWSCGAPGIYQIFFTELYFGDAPAIALGMIENVPQVTWELTAFDADSCTVRIYEIDTKNPIDMPFTIMAAGIPGG